MQPIKLYESLFILYKCNHSINHLWQPIEKNQESKDKLDSDAYITFNHIIMESVSFLAEFNETFYYNAEEEYKQSVKDIKAITKPILKRINNWVDLSKFRNNIIAHPWRDRGKFVIPSHSAYNIPKSWFELQLLVYLMNYVWSMVFIELKQEVLEAHKYFSSMKPDSSEQIDYSGMNDDHENMREEVNKLCIERGKVYKLRVRSFILE